MTASREIELIRELNTYEQGTRAYQRVLDELVLANVGLCHKVVHKFPIKNSNCSYDDLYQEAIAGLIHGIQKFDCTRGYRLSTYSYRWIQAYVSRYYQNQGKTIRLPVHMANKQHLLKKSIEKMTTDLGRTPTDEEIRAVVPNMDELQKSMRDCISLNQLISDSEELDCLQGEDNTEERDYIMEVEMALDRLKEEVSARDFNIFIHREGLLGVAPSTLNEIAEYHQLTRSRVHQISNHVFSKMKEVVTQ
tara:strand:+ start:71 stop:817 length:747 start_codon:yes stop_codon:yes gene_type:complete